MSDGAASFFRTQPGRSQGCPRETEKQPGDTGWVCTDHFEWMGELLHVGCSTNRVVGAWFDKDRSWGWNHDHITECPSRNIKELQEFLLRQPGFFVPPTDDEVDAAAQQLSRMLQEIESKTAR